MGATTDTQMQGKNKRKGGDSEATTQRETAPKNKKRPQPDPINGALRRVRAVPWAFDAGSTLPPDFADDEQLKNLRAACTSLLKLTSRQRERVLQAAQALDSDGEPPAD